MFRSRKTCFNDITINKNINFQTYHLSQTVSYPHSDKLIDKVSERPQNLSVTKVDKLINMNNWPFLLLTASNVWQKTLFSWFSLWSMQQRWGDILLTPSATSWQVKMNLKKMWKAGDKKKIKQDEVFCAPTVWTKSMLWE